MSLAMIAGLAMPVFAQVNLLDMVLMMKMDNEQVLQQDFDYSLTAEFVDKVKAGKELTPAQLDFGKRRCEYMLQKIGTPKKRAKIIKQMMREIDDEILMMVDRIQGMDEFEGRRISVNCRRRLKSLLEYETQRYTYFLEVLNSVPAPQ
jgi:hypothetical protein